MQLVDNIPASEAWVRATITLILSSTLVDHGIVGVQSVQLEATISPRDIRVLCGKRLESRNQILHCSRLYSATLRFEDSLLAIRGVEADVAWEIPTV
jgi:hypothetical protein